MLYLYLQSNFPELVIVFYQLLFVQSFESFLDCETSYLNRKKLLLFFYCKLKVLFKKIQVEKFIFIENFLYLSFIIFLLFELPTIKIVLNWIFVLFRSIWIYGTFSSDFDGKCNEMLDKKSFYLLWSCLQVLIWIMEISWEFYSRFLKDKVCGFMVKSFTA
jgi:hypothetical protein